MPASSVSFNEWLPGSLAGAGVGGSSGSSSGRKPGFASAVRSVQCAMAPVREHAQTAAACAGVPNSVTQSGKDTCCPNLTIRERVQGCLGCLALGFVISFLSVVSWWTGNTATFAVLYTVGNIVSLCGSGFLFGPRRQLRNMGRAGRRWATGIYLLMMVVTLTLAFIHAFPLFIILSVFLQWCALVWYIASYIPFGQKIITKVLGKVTEF